MEEKNICSEKTNSASINASSYEIGFDNDIRNCEAINKNSQLNNQFQDRLMNKSENENDLRSSLKQCSSNNLTQNPININNYNNANNSNNYTNLGYFSEESKPFSVHFKTSTNNNNFNNGVYNNFSITQSKNLNLMYNNNLQNNYNINLKMYNDQINFNNTSNNNNIQPNYNNNQQMKNSVSSAKIDKSHLKDMRITMPNILFVIGLSHDIIKKSKEELSGENYFGHYGKVCKVAINDRSYDKTNRNGPIYSAHINFSTEKETCLAMLSLHDKFVMNNKFKASFGTTKYCKNFIEGKYCHNTDCFYYHKIDESKEMNKNEINQNKDSIYINQIKTAISKANIFDNSIRKQIINKPKNPNLLLPHISTIYENTYVKDYETEIKNKINSLSSKETSPSLEKKLETLMSSEFKNDPNSVSQYKSAISYNSLYSNISNSNYNINNVNISNLNANTNAHTNTAIFNSSGSKNNFCNNSNLYQSFGSNYNNPTPNMFNSHGNMMTNINKSVINTNVNNNVNNLNSLNPNNPYYGNINLKNNTMNSYMSLGNMNKLNVKGSNSNIMNNFNNLNSLNSFSSSTQPIKMNYSTTHGNIPSNPPIQVSSNLKGVIKDLSSSNVIAINDNTSNEQKPSSHFDSFLKNFTNSDNNDKCSDNNTNSTNYFESVHNQNLHPKNHFFSGNLHNTEMNNNVLRLNSFDKRDQLHSFNSTNSNNNNLHNDLELDKLSYKFVSSGGYTPLHSRLNLKLENNDDNIPDIPSLVDQIIQFNSGGVDSTSQFKQYNRGSIKDNLNINNNINNDKCSEINKVKEQK